MSAAEPPVVPGRIHGLRQWALDNAKPPHLRAVVYGQPWPQGGVPFAARCVGHSHAAPSAHCSCGIYAWHPRADNAEYVFPSRDWLGSVTGIIEAWGEVEVHHDGFRAQYARPRWLVLPDRADLETRRRMAEIAAAYGAEVIACANSGELEGHCSRLHRRRNSRRTGSGPVRRASRAGPVTFSSSWPTGWSRRRGSSSRPR